MKKTTILLVLIYTSILFSQKVPDNPKVTAYRTTEKITLDAIINEEVWNNPPVTDLIQREPDEGKPATQKSKIWVAYDNKYLYVAGKFNDTNPELIDRALMRRDNIVESDWFWLFLDTYNDDRNGFFFAVNAGGSIADGTMFNDSWDDNSWDGIWESKTKIDDDGWSLEMKIPLSQLRFNESEEMVWGVNFNRDIKRNGENSFYKMVSRKESGFISHFPDLVGLNGIKSKQRFEALPYLVQKASYLIHDDKDPFYKGNQYQTSLGADFKIGVGSNFNVDATINPDFGQVEVDPAVVNLSAFETFFQEKRPFFIEGQNLFYFGVGGANNNWGFNFSNPKLFYSRRIGRSPQGETPDYDFIDRPRETRILGAAKLTGKIDDSWSLGAVSAATERTYATIDNNGDHSEHEVEPFTHYGVLRSQKEFNDGNQSLGFMFTGVNRDLRTDNLRNSLNRNAYTFGLDGWTFLDTGKVYVLTAYAVGSYIEGTNQQITNMQERSYRYFQRPDATYSILDTNRTSLAGIYSRIMLNKQEGNFYVNSAIGFVTPGFENNDLGFQWNADKINGHLVLGYRWYESDNIFRRKILYVAHSRNYDFEGNISNNIYGVFGNFQFLNYYSFGFETGYLTEGFSRTTTRGGPLVQSPSGFFFGGSLSSDGRKNLKFEANGNISSDGLGGNGYSISVETEWKPNTQLTLSIEPEYSKDLNKRQWVGDFEDAFATKTFGKRYVFSDLNQKSLSASIRLNWSFTPTLSLQLYMQPLLAIGNYSKFNELAQASTMDVNNYGENGSTITYNSNDDEYTIDADGNGPSEQFSFGNPNFNFKSLRGTIVLRWEAMPGSIFYLVWSQDRANYNDPGELQFNRDFSNLLSSETNNILLAKFSYWLDI
ncbi:MAG: carbohydrate binding family 9 domain-containing protein [Ignavibacteriae bacterium]|nr:carbohydrate binding family 9 domain-containing protein [Ignavibacteriota bacterium]